MLLQTICLLYASIRFAFSLTREYILVEPTEDLYQDGAEAFCASTYQVYNGHLASIDSESVNEEVASLCPDTPARNDGCYIGLIAGDTDPTTWTDGAPVTYSNWMERSRGGYGEQPVVIPERPAVIIKPGAARGGGKWRTARDVGFPFICQKDTTIAVGTNEISIYGDRLLPNERLYTGESLVSSNRRFVAVLQGDGNFVVYDTLNGGATATWATYQFGTSERFVTLQASDGNVVIYSTTSGAQWATHDYNSNPGFLIMQSDGNLVAYAADGTAYWDSWGHSGVWMAFLNHYYEPSTQELLHHSVSLIATLIGVLTCVLLICVYGIKRRVTKKELQPLMETSGSYSTF